MLFDFATSAVKPLLLKASLRQISFWNIFNFHCKSPPDTVMSRELKSACSVPGTLGVMYEGGLVNINLLIEDTCIK